MECGGWTPLWMERRRLHPKRCPATALQKGFGNKLEAQSLFLTGFGRRVHDGQQFLTEQTPDQDQLGVRRQVVGQSLRLKPRRPGDELQSPRDLGRPVDA